ncbi:hypothetical protein HQ584_13260 [Patescibacteria group bacterium]|nr:hypothetical protein [Patescibacteria group bacterium]
MKKILVMGLVLVLVVGVMSVPTYAFIRLKGGYFMPAESAEIEEGGEKVPDGGIIYGGELTTTLGGILGLGIGADYFPYSKTIEGVKGNWTTGSAIVTLYFIPGAKFYLGAGAGYYIVNVSVEGEDNFLGSGLGYHGVVGWNITRRIFIEGKYSTCTVDNWEKGGGPYAFGISDIGGIIVMFGFNL